MKVDVEIISDHALYAEDVEWCIAELCKAVGADYDDTNKEVYEWQGAYGYVEYSTDEHRYHCVDVTAYEHADLLAIMQIVASMCSKGCTVLCYDKDNRAHENYLQELHYQIQQF